MRYAFTLKDAVTDCDEWMVPKQPFVELAAEFGLELIEWRNFHDFVGDALGPEAPPEKARRARDLWRQTTGGKTPEQTPMSADEWEAARLYAVFAFRMSGSAEAAALSQQKGHPRRRRNAPSPKTCSCCAARRSALRKPKTYA